MSVRGRLASQIRRLEHWIEDRPRPLLISPLRLLASMALIVLLIASNFIALARWPLSALRRAANRSQPQNGRPIHVGASEFDQMVAARPLVVVDFWAEWCGPCLLLNGVLEEFARERPDVAVLKVDTTLHPTLASKYNVGGLPTLLLIRDGAEVDRRVGMISPQELDAFVGEPGDCG